MSATPLGRGGHQGPIASRSSVGHRARRPLFRVPFRVAHGFRSRHRGGVQEAPASGVVDPRPWPDARDGYRTAGTSASVVGSFVELVCRRLLAWALACVGLGALLLAAGDPFGRGLGLGLLASGLVKVAMTGAIRGLAREGDASEARDRLTGREAGRRIRYLLGVNGILDAACIAGGLWLIAGSGDAFRLGGGAGIVLQGGALLAFDVLHTRWIPGPEPVFANGLPLFTGPEHRPLTLAPATAAGSTPAVSGALLLHGFGGSPAELRRLATRLGQAGWMVEVPLLPGHGSEIRELPHQRVEDWLTEVEAAAGRLRNRGASRLLVVGHSMGAALALTAASTIRPDGVVLMAPFWWEESWWQRPLRPVLRPFLPPGFKVFRRLDLHAPEVRRGLASFLPGIDLEDPAVIAALRDMTVPIELFEQLYRVSRMAVAAAPGLRCPVLGIQGLDDKVVLPERTRRLLALLPVAPHPVLVRADHDLLTDACPARDEVLAAVLAFALEIGGPQVDGRTGTVAPAAMPTG